MTTVRSIAESIRRTYVGSLSLMALALVAVTVASSAYVAIQRDDAATLSQVQILDGELRESREASLEEQDEHVRHEMAEQEGSPHEMEIWKGARRLGWPGQSNQPPFWRMTRGCSTSHARGGWERVCAFEIGGGMTLVSATGLRPLLAKQLPIWGAVAVCTGLAVLALALLSRRVVEASLTPLASFEREMAKLPAETGARLPTAWSATEIDQLARTFNSLLARIDEMVEREQTFASNAAHELRTPLTRLRGQLGLLLEEPAVRGEIRERLERAQLTCVELVDCTEALLALSHRVASLDEAVDLAEVALTVRNGLREQDVKRVELSASEAIVRGDTALVRLAVQNLVENALKYSDGRIDVEVRSDDDECLLMVADAGPGIPEAELAVVREPFQRGSKRRGDVRGTGLGLALVDHVASLHGGRLELANRVAPRGLLASLHLPPWSPRKAA
ncbi:MAG TPA: ATP-binding protein [Polyangiaceae bacterium]|nr:ATP-binding protein [Polyangiaceae bacterium]